MNWPVQEAEQRFSELIRSATTDGPQVVTHHGEEIAVVIDIAEYRRLRGEIVDFEDFLRSEPGLEDLDLTRSREVPRNLDWMV
ncbi:type II toxin-antitoxin system prevent-host-death family antitoxin [Nocardia sp. R6R-6]|uniref:type II toxin-antitoxin system prevent-host-death family antitoxin n=1 Tax=Nocardia sp. R6R-6 TaxID=3459303 RepID=UPI00403D6676